MAGAAAASVGDPLRLPRLASAVPLSIRPRDIAAANASVARFLIEAGVIREGDIPETWDDAIAVCERALDTWVKREIGALHCLQPAFALTALDTSGTGGGAPGKAAFRYDKVNVSWAERHEQQWVIGPGLEALERLRCGLGQMVLRILSWQSRFVYPLFTPDLTGDVSSYLYWGGEADEEAALDMECGNDEKARAAMREEMITRQKLADAYPEWAMTSHARWSQIELRNTLEALANHQPAGNIAADALALSRMRIKDRYRPEIDGEFIGFGAVLSWREDDLTVRIYDDLLQFAYQAEFCELIGEVEFDLDAPQALRGWQRDMRARFKTIRLIDGLIYKLSEGN